MACAAPVSLVRWIVCSLAQNMLFSSDADARIVAVADVVVFDASLRYVFLGAYADPGPPDRRH